MTAGTSYIMYTQPCRIVHTAKWWQPIEQLQVLKSAVLAATDCDVHINNG